MKNTSENPLEKYGKRGNKLRNVDNITETANPKPLTVQRVVNYREDGSTEVLIFHNVLVHPRALLQ
jgi:hypothetical protein